MGNKSPEAQLTLKAAVTAGFDFKSGPASFYTVIINGFKEAL